MGTSTEKTSEVAKVQSRIVQENPKWGTFWSPLLFASIKSFGSVRDSTPRTPVLRPQKICGNLHAKLQLENTSYLKLIEMCL